MSSSLSGYAHVCDYFYRSPAGVVIFVKQRFEALDPMSGVRTKTFRYFDPTTRIPRKPAGADRWLYNLDRVVPAIGVGHTIHWAEGEKDADALQRAGVVATSHHQGAGKVTLDQAAWLRNARRVVLWVDLDRGHWEVGAYDAARRYQQLLALGVPAASVRFVRARTGKDAADHIEAGYTPQQALKVDRYRLAKVAAGFRPATAHRMGYPRAR